jgi:hypothetical protein
MPAPALSVIVPWCQRPHLREMLAWNARWLEAADADLVVVNCAGDGEAVAAMLQETPVRRPVRRRRQIDVPADRFNKSLALNLGLHFAEAAVVATIDADILLADGILDRGDRCLRERCFLTFRRVIDSSQDRPPRPDPGGYLQGVVTEWTSEFIWADGTRTRVEGWGWEDLDVHLRLLRLGLERVWIDTQVTHLSHDNERRDLTPGQTTADAGRRNLHKACTASARRDFCGTYTGDVARWAPRCRIR